MPRSTKEWIGRTDDTAPPPRVRLRVLLSHHRQCVGCTRPIHLGDTFACDHRQPLILNGQNRESNLQPLCSWCHKPKTAGEIAQKSRDYKRRLKHSGIKRKSASRPLIGTIASGWKHRMDGRWERR